MGKRLFVISFFIFAINDVYAQQYNNLRVKYIQTRKNTVVLDTLSIVPNSFLITDRQSQVVDTSAFRLDFAAGLLIWNKASEGYKSIKSDSIQIHYRVFSEFFAKKNFHKDYDRALKNLQTADNPYIYSSNQGGNADFFKMQGLNKAGSISRGISFGNNQDVFVNSSLNLQLSGKLSDNVDILAAITDENIPVQPEGNTQQLQEFDKVFIQLSDKKSKLIAGDFELKRPNSYFMNFYAKAQGGSFSTSIDVLKDKNGDVGINKIMVAAAVSKGKQARNLFNGIEGNQGPYRLTGNNNETFIIVIAGSEKVYLDGVLLDRGQQNDYVIDYNTAEITFTPKRLITKDSRLSVEFEYSDQNYARSVLFFGDEFTKKKLRLNFNIYSEQDSKNQPLQVQLDSAKLRLLDSIGNNISQAVYPSYDSVAFNNTEVLYAKTDSIVNAIKYPNVFYYTTDSTMSHWLVTFSFVGNNLGDYIQDVNAANGKVFKWIAPVNNVHQGTYIPAILIITPKKQQMATLGADYQLSKNNKVSVEMALSDYDANLLSSKDKENDVGYAMKGTFLNTTLLNPADTNGWKSSSTFNYEYVQRNFTPIERYRPVEFDRDWNITATTPDDENLASLETMLSRKSVGNISYSLHSFRRGNDYNALDNMLGTNLTWNKFHLLANGSYLNTQDTTSKTQYYKHLEDLSRTIGKFLVGARDEEEHNSFYKPASDSLYANSFAFKQYSAYIGYVDSSKNSFRLDYKQRTDWSPLNPATGQSDISFNKAIVAQDISFTTAFTKNPKNSLRTTTTYRRLDVQDTTLTAQQPEKTLLNRIEYNLTTLKGVVSTNTFYEIGTGQELKQTYSFLPVAPGQGVYQWIDYNHDGIQQLNEFVIAAFQSDADYVKILIPTNEFISTRTNAFNEVFNLTPAAASQSTTAKKKFIARLSDQFQLQLNRKTLDQNLANDLNPFQGRVQDTSIISTNSTLRNTVFFNRTSSVIGADYNYQQLKTKSLLTNGFEFRVQTTNTANIRWNVSRIILLQSSFQTGEKQNNSELFASNTYDIMSQQAEPKISYQLGTSFRATLSYMYSHKLNTEVAADSVAQESFSNKIQIEVRYSTVTSGSFTAHISYTGIKFNSSENSPLAYDMLEGLHNGENIVWGLGIQRNLSKELQLSVNYDGRKSEGINAIHTANVQLRAYF